MINWSVAITTPPPLLSTVSNDDLEHFHFHVDVLSDIPCNSQAVECTIKDISATTMKVFIDFAVSQISSRITEN